MSEYASKSAKVLAAWTDLTRLTDQINRNTERMIWELHHRTHRQKPIKPGILIAINPRLLQ